MYDLSSFLTEHPGGKKVISRFAGKDATPGFDPIHPKDIIQKTMGKEPSAYIGDVDPATLNAADSATKPEQHETNLVPVGELPTLDRMLNYFDFEAVAKAKMGRSGWDYYSSGGDDEITLRENHIAFQRLWLRPRVLLIFGHHLKPPALHHRHGAG